MRELLARFIQSFQRAISAEMDAMRASLGPFEVALKEGRATEKLEEDGTRPWVYDFTVASANDKLVAGMECSLRHEQSEYLVAIDRLDRGSVRLSSAGEIPLGEGSWILVLYPWFLYEKLQVALAETPGLFPQNALRLFGKYSPSFDEQTLDLPHRELNASQVRAVELCCRSNLAFVWGPPGTGKTMTLGHIVTELLHQGYRVLVTSTTNAAVDQALAKLADLSAAATYFSAGQVLRIGQMQGETFGASLGEVLSRLTRDHQQRLERLEERLGEVRNAIRDCAALREKMGQARIEEQIDLFAPPRPDPGISAAQEAVFSPRYQRHFVDLDPDAQQDRVDRRQARLEGLALLCQARIEDLWRDLRRQEAMAVGQARVILATMTNVYLSKLLGSEHFDVVIVEEAGMAILPVLFYCAARAREKVIMVGDPKQLPPIVQSRDPYVRQAMGRSIFAVTVPDPRYSEIVVLLEMQYRMHPVIGRLVSDMFYDGRLGDGEGMQERAALAARHPYPDQALVVVDTEGATRCATHPGSFSRFNQVSAGYCVGLARKALQDGVDSIGIITPYVEQARLIRKELAASREREGVVECSTVHRFQGNERDLIILDTVDAEPLDPGVLLAGRGPESDAAHLLNVSISRARGKLVIVADIAYFKARSPDSLINRLLERAVRGGVKVSMDAE